MLYEKDCFTCLIVSLNDDEETMLSVILNKPPEIPSSREMISGDAPFEIQSKTTKIST